MNTNPDTIIEQLEDSDWETRRSAIEGCSVENHKVELALIRILKEDSEDFLRAEALEALVQITARAKQFVQIAMQDPSDIVRAEGAYWAGENNITALCHDLESNATTNAPDLTAIESCVALFKIGRRPDFSSLHVAAISPEYRIRCAVANIIRRESELIHKRGKSLDAMDILRRMEDRESTAAVKSSIQSARVLFPQP